MKLLMFNTKKSKQFNQKYFYFFYYLKFKEYTLFFPQGFIAYLSAYSSVF